MVKIPKQLQNPAFRFVLLGKSDMWARHENKGGKRVLVETKQFHPTDYKTINQKVWKALGKAPYESAWQNKDYDCNNPKLLNHTENFGIIGGYGKLVVLDIDDPILAEELEKQLDTFTTKTGSGGRHFYFIVENGK